jgi:hypothetical protein
VDLPELAPSEQALLHRFRADESPSDAVVRRVEARLAARLDAADDPRPLAPVLPFSHFGKAAVIALALAAAVLLVLGGGARLVHAVRTDKAIEQASDVHARVAPTGEAHSVAPAPAATAPTPSTTAPVVIPLPPAQETVESVPIDLAAVPGALDASRRDATPRGKARTEPAPTMPAPADAAAEIALLFAAKREAQPEQRLAKLREHASKFPNGALGEEIAVLEIQTLCELGRTERAAEKSAGFLRAHPDSAFAAIARRGCAREDGRR